MDKNKQQNTIRLLFGRHWKTVFNDYCKAVSNRKLIESAESQLSGYEAWLFLSTLTLLSLFFTYLGGLNIVLKAWTIYAALLVFILPFHIEKHLERINPRFNVKDARAQVWICRISGVGLLGTFFALSGLYSFLGKPFSGLDSLLLVVYLALSYVVPNMFLNRIVPEKFVVPDHSKLLKSDNTLDVKQAPDPRPDGNFAIGVDEKNEYVYWNFDGKYYHGNIIFTGQSRLFGKESFINTFIHGALGAETDAVFLIYDWQHGLDFSYLRKDRRALLARKDIDCLYNDEWMGVLGDLPRLPNVAVFDQNEISKSLEWLEEEFERRQHESGLVPNAYFPTRIVVVLDWDLTGKLLESANGLNVSILKRIFKADPRLKMNILAVANPETPWSDFKTLTQFSSGIQFFTSAQSGEKGEKKNGDREIEKTSFVSRTFDIPPLLYKAKVWQRGSSRIISLLDCDSDYLAEYVYRQAGNNKPETFALWKAACYFRSFQESETKKEILVNM